MLVCSNLGLWQDKSVSSLSAGPVRAHGHGLDLCVARQPGSGPGWGCSWSLPGRASNPVASTPFALSFFCVAEGLQEFWPPESSAPLLSCVGTGCHNADTLAAPTG